MIETRKHRVLIESNITAARLDGYHGAKQVHVRPSGLPCAVCQTHEDVDGHVEFFAGVIARASEALENLQ